MLTDTSKGWRIHSTSIKAANKRKMIARGPNRLEEVMSKSKEKNSSLTKRHAE